jgi:hypothetical protein
MGGSGVYIFGLACGSTVRGSTRRSSSCNTRSRCTRGLSLSANHSTYSRGSKMTGCLLWICAIFLFGSVVMIANVSSHCPVFGFCHAPQMPAMPRTFLPLDERRYFGRGSAAVFFHSKKEATGTMQRLCSRSLQKGAVVTLSERALNSRRSGSLNPQRISPIRRSPSFV